ncbi:MauE/DoxX family redox-associated membrane protein [Bacillaceae bacterium CLA-AA-H227]|uniref:MauE/DoxX family redox-associated membrane protein n=1 Tax=Robertmurraya yapensis (ex Hitch et al 2024) TaxID=3133160 RepID=A0ACC6SBU5_9BACI
MQLLYNILVHLLLIVLIVSSIPKIINLKDFLNLVKEFDFLPLPILKLYGTILPFTELAGAFLLPIKGMLVYASILIFTVFLSITIGVEYMLKTNKTITCGCYGRFLDSDVSQFTLIKLLFLSSISLMLAFFHNQIQVEIELFSLLAGLFLATILISTEKIWNNHKDVIKNLS